MKNKSFFTMATAIAALMTISCLFFVPDTSPEISTPVPPTHTSTLEAATETLATTTALPPLPDFDEQVLTFDSGGGGGLCTSNGETPSITGWADTVLNGTICIWGVDFGNYPFKITLVSPDNKIVLSANFKFDSSRKTLTWEGHNAAEISAYTISAQNCLGINFLWRAGNPGGQWQVFIKWGNEELQGVIDAAETTWESIELYDVRAENEILPSTHWMTDIPNGFQVIGMNYPPLTSIIVNLYRYIDSTAQISPVELIFQTTVKSDTSGNFQIIIPYNAPYQPGRYVIVANTNLEASFVNEEQFILLGNKGMQYDIFRIP